MNAPWSVQVELVEGCNRMCRFCGIHSIRKGAGDYKFMNIVTAIRASEGIAALCPTARIEFAMRGEPTIHPLLYDFIDIFRRKLPKAQMQLTTNGRLWLKGMQQPLDRLWAMGLDFVVVDTYEPDRDRLRQLARALKRARVLDYYDDMLPKGQSIYANYHRKMNRTLILLDDLEARNGEARSRVITNQGGNSVVTRAGRWKSLEKTCTRAFREVTVSFDGDVCICCDDWGHELVCGNVNSQTLSSIWFGERFQALRAMLQQKRRWVTPCSRCDIGSGSRSGLLPKLPDLTIEQKRIIVTMVNAGTGRNGKESWIHPALIEEVKKDGG